MWLFIFIILNLGFVEGETRFGNRLLQRSDFTFVQNQFDDRRRLFKPDGQVKSHDEERGLKPKAREDISTQDDTFASNVAKDVISERLAQKIRGLKRQMRELRREMRRLLQKCKTLTGKEKEKCQKKILKIKQTLQQLKERVARSIHQLRLVAHKKVVKCLKGKCRKRAELLRHLQRKLMERKEKLEEMTRRHEKLRGKQVRAKVEARDAKAEAKSQKSRAKLIKKETRAQNKQLKKDAERQKKSFKHALDSVKGKMERKFQRKLRRDEDKYKRKLKKRVGRLRTSGEESRLKPGEENDWRKVRDDWARRIDSRLRKLRDEEIDSSDDVPKPPAQPIPEVEPAPPSSSVLNVDDLREQQRLALLRRIEMLKAEQKEKLLKMLTLSKQASSAYGLSDKVTLKDGDGKSSGQTKADDSDDDDVLDMDDKKSNESKNQKVSIPDLMEQEDPELKKDKTT